MMARIFRPAKSAMTSGYGNSQDWVLEFSGSGSKQVDPLMGWTGGGSTRGQVRISFETKDEAITYARRHGIPFTVEEGQKRAPNVRPRGYGGNFAHDRRGSWTH